ncbi:MAG TPA: glycosyltransferase, partial [Thermoanaerobaculia bacterium]|nr:glycosyltransferase [Thermoanaerobaculia bacterium]
ICPAGEAHKREIEQLVRDLGVAEAVIFTGERRDVPDLLASFDVALQCSLNENLGGSVEALLMARPTVVTNVGGLVDTVRHEQTGLVVPPDDPQALAAAILRLLRDRPFAARLGRNGRALMLERFSLARSVADLETLYQREAAQAPRGYRLLTSAARLAHLPFRVLPLAFRVQTALGGGSAARALVRLAAAFVRRIVHRTLKRAPSRTASPRTATQAATQPRIAHIAAASSGSQWLVDFASETARRGFDVLAVIDAAPGDLRERLLRAGIRVRTVPMVFGERLDRTRLPLYLARLPLSALKLAWILRRERIDIAHSHIFVANLVTRLARILTPVRHVAGITGPRHLEAPLTRDVDRKTWWLDDVTAAGCRHTLELYRRLGAPPERLECIYYGVPAERFTASNTSSVSSRAEREARSRGTPCRNTSDVPAIGLAAWFYPPTSGPQTPHAMRGTGLKGHETFLDAARIVAGRFPDARFLLAGKGAGARGEEYRRSLLERCADDDILRDRVHFLGHVDDVPSFLASLDVAVQCSLTENLGGTIEALLMERPLVATRTGGMPESVRDEETGLLVPPGDANALAAAIMRLLDDRDLAARLGRAGRALMLRHFTLEKSGDALAALYTRLAAPGIASIELHEEART